MFRVKILNRSNLLTIKNKVYKFFSIYNFFYSEALIVIAPPIFLRIDTHVWICCKFFSTKVAFSKIKIIFIFFVKKATVLVKFNYKKNLVEYFMPNYNVYVEAFFSLCQKCHFPDVLFLNKNIFSITINVLISKKSQKVLSSSTKMWQIKTNISEYLKNKWLVRRRVPRYASVIA